MKTEAEKEVIECVSSQPLPGGLPRYAVTGGCTKDPYTGECDPDYAMTAVVGAALMPTSTELVDRFDAQCNGGKCDASFHRVGCNPMTNQQVLFNGKIKRNCTEACEIFLSCVGAAPYAGKGVLANKSSWLIPGELNLYNKSLVMEARSKCFDARQDGVGQAGRDAAYDCVDILIPGPDDPPVSRDNPKSATCLDFDCFFCGQTLWSKYFLCATTHCGQVPAAQPCVLVATVHARAGHASATPALTCTASAQNMTHPSPECSDCSYNFEDMYNEIDMMRDKLWEAYFVGAIGKIPEPSDLHEGTVALPNMCSPNEPGSVDPNVPMTDACRRFHYPIEDFLNTDHVSCLKAMQDSPGKDPDPARLPASSRCLSLDRVGQQLAYNFEQDVFEPDVDKARVGQVQNATTPGIPDDASLDAGGDASTDGAER